MAKPNSVTIAIDGSLYKKHPRFDSLLKKYIHQFAPEREVSSSRSKLNEYILSLWTLSGTLSYVDFSISSSLSCWPKTGVERELAWPQQLLNALGAKLVLS
jgi:hypothetical protein